MLAINYDTIVIAVPSDMDCPLSRAERGFLVMVV